MANSGANTNGSQFFIVYQDTQLDPNYAVIGHILQGLDVAKKVAAAGVTPADPSNPSDGAPKLEVKINSLTITKPAASLPTLPPVTPVAPASAAGSGSPTSK
jgi:peptidyl-prolyl cis-trans isomerase B (cyclophilin B)